MSATLVTVSYVGATILFILSLGGLSHPETSRRGNVYGIIGMIIAVVATVAGPRVVITSYSIHYTKLYDCRSTHETPRVWRSCAQW